MNKLTVIQQAAIFVMKAVLLYLMLPLLWMDITLFGAAIPKYFFEKQPFFMAAILVAVIAATISIIRKSTTPILWAVFVIAYSAVFFVSLFPSLALIAICLAIGAVSFLYRSRFTEPFLVLLPIIAGAWLFLQFVYGFSLVAWANYITGQRSLVDSLFQGVLVLNDQAMQIAIIVPLITMYLLGKHSYVKLYPIFKSLRK